MKSAWIRIIEKHTFPIELKDQKDINLSSWIEKSGSTTGKRKVYNSDIAKNRFNSKAYLKVYPRGLEINTDALDRCGSPCFIAQIVDLSDDDFLILYRTKYDFGPDKIYIESDSIYYLPWDKIGTIRFSNEEKKNIT